MGRKRPHPNTTVWLARSGRAQNSQIDLFFEVPNRQSTLVRPGIPIPPEASAVHHLIDEDLADAPPLMNAIHLFRGADAYVAHNADFEQSFLGPRLGEATWVCTYKCALRIWPGPARPQQPGAPVSARLREPVRHR